MERLGIDAEKAEGVLELMRQAGAEARADAEKRFGLERRFEKAVGGRRFVHGLVEESVKSRFMEEAEEAQGHLSDAELLDSLSEGGKVFAAVTADMPQVNAALTAGDPERLSDAEYYASIGLK